MTWTFLARVRQDAQALNLLFFRRRIRSNLSKLDQTWSNMIIIQDPLTFPKFSTFSTFYKFLIFFTNLLALDYKNSNLFLIRFDQICPKQIKLDRIWISHLSKNVNIKSCHIYHENNHGQLFLTRSDKICPKWIKLDQIWISHLSKMVMWKVIFIRIKWDLNGSNLIKLDFW